MKFNTSKTLQIDINHNECTSEFEMTLAQWQIFNTFIHLPIFSVVFDINSSIRSKNSLDITRIFLLKT